MNFLIRSAKDTSNHWLPECVHTHTGKESLTVKLQSTDDVRTLGQILAQTNRLKEPYNLVLLIDHLEDVEYPAVTNALTQLFTEQSLNGISLQADTHVLVTCPHSPFDGNPLMDADLVRASAFIDLDKAPGEIDTMQKMLTEALEYESLDDYHDTLLEERRLGVIVIQMASDEDIDADDEGLEGVYEIRINEFAPDFLAYELALESFHTNIAVSTLDNFEFHVFDLDTKKPLESFGFTMDGLNDYGCEKVASQVPRWAERALNLQVAGDNSYEPQQP